MKLWRLLALPWQVTQRGMRRVVIALLGAAVIGAVAVAIFSGKPDVSIRVAVIIGVAEALVWSFCLSNAVPLTVDAHQLRMPGVTRHVVAGVLRCAVLGWLLPALVIDGFGGHAVMAGVLIALLSVCGFLYSLLPRMPGIALYTVFIVAVIHASSRSWPTRPDFLAWALPVLVGGLALTAVCWRRLVLAPDPCQLSWSTPSALRAGRTMSAAMAGRGTVSRPRGRPEWLQAHPDLRSCGPDHPVQSLRMAFGGSGAPHTFVGWWRRPVPWSILVGLLCTGLLAFVSGGGSGRNMTVYRNAVTMVLGWMAGICVLHAIVMPFHLSARWRLVNAELPLLALLPRLGNHLKRDVLSAALLPPLRLLLMATGLVMLMVVELHEYAIGACALLVVSGVAGNVIALTLRVVGGVSLGRLQRAAVIVSGFLLSLAGVIVTVYSSDPDSSRQLLGVLWSGLFVGWLVFVVMLFWLGRNGWLGLQQRPHPFLVI